MEGFVSVGRLDGFPEGVMRACDVAGRDVAVLNCGGELHAFSNFCPHEGVTLTAGYGFVSGSTVVCMMHSSLFDVVSGAVLAGPADSGLEKYEVRISGEDVQVRAT